MKTASLPASAAGTSGLTNSGNFGAVTTGTAMVLGAQAPAAARTSTSEETASVRIMKILLRAGLARVRM